MDRLFKQLCAFYVSLLVWSIRDVNSTASTVSEGCHDDNPLTREFAMPAYDFYPNNLDPDMCRDRCADMAFTYAGLQQGNLCFCTNAYTATDIGYDCDEYCTSPSDTNFCGGHNQNSVWESTPIIRNLAITPFESSVAAYTEASVIITMTSGTAERYEIQSEGSASQETHLTSPVDYYFRQAGLSELVVTAVDPESNEATYVLPVNVLTVIRDLTVTCPDAVQVFEEFFCTVELREGSSVGAVINFGDNTILGDDSPMWLSDTIPFIVGDVAADVIDGSEQPASSDNLFLAFNEIIRKEGTFKGWEFNVETPGSFTFMILRPKCGTGEQFCFRSYTCIGTSIDCSRETNRWAKRCTSGSVYSFTRKECVDTTTNNVIPSYFTDSWQNLAIHQYVMVHEDSFTTARTGTQYEESSAMDVYVEPGDVIAMLKNTGALYQQDIASSCYEISAYTNHIVGQSFLFTGDYHDGDGACFNAQHQFRAHLLKVTRASYKHMYTSGGEFNVAVVAVSSLNYETASTVVSVLEPIDSINFTAVAHERTNTAVTFTCGQHTGTDVTYNWTYTDGEQDSIFNVTTATHTFTQPGVYTVRLYAYNAISNAEYEQDIIIQDPIENFVLTTNSTFTPAASAVGEFLFFFMRISRGTNVTYFLDVGEEYGQHYTFSIDRPLPTPQRLMEFQEFRAVAGHPYWEIGNYSVSANVSNLVSNATGHLFIPVQETIEEMSIVQPSVIEYGEAATIVASYWGGSNITFTASLDGSAITNFTIEYSDYDPGYVLINLSEADLSHARLYTLSITYTNLVTPLATDYATLIVDYSVENCEIEMDRPFVPVNEVVTFNMSIQWGSRFTLTISFGDNTADWDTGITYDLDGRDVSHLPGANADPFWITTHTYQSPGNFTVTYMFNNSFGPSTYTRHVVVQHGVADMTLTTDSPVAISTSSGDLQITITYTGLPADLATDPYYLYDYGDNQNDSGSLQIASSPFTSTHTYFDYGTFNLTLNISNLVGHMFFIESVDADIEITGLVISASPYHLSSGDTTNFTVTMTSGSRITLEYDFQDGATDSQTYENAIETMGITHRYTVTGNHTVTVRATNYASNVTVETTQDVVVQHPIADVTLRCDEPQALLEESLNYTEEKTCHLFVEIGTPRPTEVYYEVDWDDGETDSETLIVAADADSALDTSSHLHMVTFTHPSGYRSAGNFTVAVRLRNLVSNTVVYFNHSIRVGIAGVYINASWTEGNSSMDGFGNTDSAFRLSEPVVLRAGYDYGSPTMFSWDFDDGNVQNSGADPEISHQFQNPGTYQVSVTASRGSDSETATRGILVQREVPSSLRITGDSPRPANNTVTFQITLSGNAVTDLGTDACYKVDFGGDADSDLDLYFFGNLTQCGVSFPNEYISLLSIFNTRVEQVSLSDVDLATHSDGSHIVYTVSNHYMTVGTWPVTVTGVNIVSQEEATFNAVVTEGPCYNPSVDLDSENQCTAGVDCDPVRSILTKKRSDDILLEARVRYNCELSSSASFVWSAALVDESSGAETDVNLSVQPNTLEGSSLRQLFLYPRSLPYGLVRIYLNVSMVGINNVFNKSSIDLYITQSELGGEIAGGVTVSRQWNTTIMIDARSLLNDPDAESGDYSGVTWTWYCKRSCESWPSFDVNYVITDTSFTSCDDPSGPGDQGCLWNDGVNGPIQPLVGGDDGEFTLDTYNVREADTINVRVVVTKDTRMVVLRQTIEIVEGDPPNIRIVCRTNCETIVNPTARYSMESSISGWRVGMQFNYSWSLYQIPNANVEDESYGQHLVEAVQWTGYASTGVHRANLAIDSGLFTAFPKHNFTYRLQVEAQRLGSETSGRSVRDFTINDAPTAGECDVWPSSGFAFATRFNVNCSTDFQDDELPLSYKVGHRQIGQEQITWIFSGSSLPMGEGKFLPPGSAAYGYMLPVVVRVTDRIGSETSLWMNVTVNPPTAAATRSIVQNITSENFDSLLEADTDEERLVTIGVYCSVLNYESDLSTGESQALLESWREQLNDPTLSDEEREAIQANIDAEMERQEQAAQTARGVMLESIASTEPQTLTAVDLVMQTTFAVTQSPEQVNSVSIDTSLSIITNSIQVVSSVSSRSTDSADDIERSLSSVVATVDNVRMSVDIQVTGSGASNNTGGNDEESDTADAVRQMNEIVVLLQTTASVMASPKVPGESDSVIPASRNAGTALGCGSHLAEDFSNKEFAVGAGTLLGISASALSDGNSTHTLTSTSMYFSSNIYSAQDVGSVQVSGSPVMSLELSDDNGTAISVQDRPELFETVLETSNEEPDVVTGDTTDYGDTMTVHRLENYTVGSAFLLYISVNDSDGADNNDSAWDVFVRINQAPTEDRFDFNFSLPLSDDRRLRTVQGLKSAILDDVTDESDNATDANGNTYRLPSKWTVFLSNVELESLSVEALYFGVKHTNMSDRSGFTSVTYSAQVYYQQCLWWVESNSSWSTSGCQVLPLSSWRRTYCGCNHLTSFAGGMVVPMNSIDLSDSAFLNLSDNPIVFATMVSIMCLYVVLCVWARKQDKIDEMKAGSTALLDNDPRDKYLYELVVWTGQRSGAGTTAKVRFIMSGEEGQTESRLLWDDKRKVLQRRGVDSFVMACSHPLGQLTHLRIWHDNSGKSPGWYFSRMQVTDMQTKDQYFFIHDRWLAVEEDDGLIDHMIPIAGKEELTSFHHLFWTQTQKNLSDGHIWFSIFQRPPRSRFTRVQRLTCCLALLFSSMMANILFYQQNEDDPEAKVYRIGPVNFTLAMIYVGFISALLVFPASIGIVALFRLSAERPAFKSQYKKENKVHTGKDGKPEAEGKRPIGASPSPPPGYYDRGVSFISTSHVKPSVEHAQFPLAKEKKKFHLPWWCIYLGYALALATVGVAFWMTVEVAGQFGPEKSKEWLFSFCISVVESIFISQPLKVVLVAVFFALIWKKPDIEEDDRPKHLRPNEQWLHTHLTEKDMDNPETVKMIKKYKSGPIQFNEEYLKAAREERFKEMKMMSIIREVLFYLLFLYVMMMVGYGNRDPWSVFVFQNMKNTYLIGNQYGEFDEFNMYSVHSRGEFWDWVQYVVLPGVYYERFYDGQTHDFLDGYTSDNNAYLIGEVRLRQVRIKNQRCEQPIRRLLEIEHCQKGFSLKREDERDYMRGWLKPNASAGEEPNRYWRYRTWMELDGYPYWGRVASYAGGGYVANLGRTNATATDTLEELIEYNWIDDRTRAVFIEFLLFNPNVNLFAVSQMAVEFTEAGSGYSTFKFHVMRLNRYMGAFMFVVLGAELLTFIFIIYYIQAEIRKIVKMRREYFKSFWNNVEVFILSLAIGCIVMFFYRLFIAQSMEDEIHEDPFKFHNFQHVIIWDEAYAYLLGLIVFLSTIKFMKLLRFNKKMSQLSSTLRYASSGLLSFLVLFLVTFCAFVQMAYLMFYAVLLDFSTFVRAAETMFSLMLNKFDFEMMTEADRLWAPVIIFSFTLFVSFILINFFLTIVIDAFVRVREDLSKQSNEYEIVDFMIDRFKRLTGIGKRKKKQQPSQIESEDYVEGVDPSAQAAEDLRARVDDMIDKLTLFVTQHTNKADFTRELNALQKKRRIVMS